MKAIHNEKCNGCKHQIKEKDYWCYMFKNKPSILPCGQHDKYKLERQLTGKLIKRNPIILYAMIQEVLHNEN